MLKDFDLPFGLEIPALEDDPALFDPDPDWVGDLELAMRDDDEYDGLGLRSVIEQPEALSKAWKRITYEEQFSSSPTRAKIRRRKRSRAA